MSGNYLSVPDVDVVATRIAEMWTDYNTGRRVALDRGQEARNYVYSTDINTTSANVLPHKNRTHLPALTSIADTLQTQYFEASLSMPDFFMYEGSNEADDEKAKLVQAWVRTKLEMKKFREETGRQLINDFVIYGNCFLSVDYVIERDENERILYKGPLLRRISPLDMVMNPMADSFQSSPKLQKIVRHVSDIAEWPDKYPEHAFNKSQIEKAIAMRGAAAVDDWIDQLKEMGLEVDGYGNYDEYYKSDTAEVLIYRGDVFNPETGETQRNRLVYVMDRLHVILNMPNPAPLGGIHHAGWRKRSDNLWAQGPLDNLAGMQYRIDHLENSKADGFDLATTPPVVIKGDSVTEPEQGFAPGAIYYTGIDGDVTILNVGNNILMANTEINQYQRLMQEYAGAPPESRGIRTPGEKTAFEVDKLDQNANMLFVDKARNFELMLEGALKEAFYLMMINFDGDDYAVIFGEDGREELRQLSQEDVQSYGDFKAVGARYWSRRNRESLELANFLQLKAQDPQGIAMHISNERLAKLIEKKLGIDDAHIVEPFIGLKEQVQGQLIAEAEARLYQEDLGQGQGDSGELQEAPEDTAGPIASTSGAGREPSIS